MRIELHLGREHPFWEFSADLHNLGLSTDLKMARLAVICCDGNSLK